MKPIVFHESIICKGKKKYTLICKDGSTSPALYVGDIHVGNMAKIAEWYLLPIRKNVHNSEFHLIQSIGRELAISLEPFIKEK